MEQRTRSLLKRVSDQLCENDLQNLKHLCYNEISFGELQKLTTGFALFECMLRKRIIASGNLKRLEELLNKSGRQDLVHLIQMSGTDENLETESAAKRTSPVKVPDMKFKAFLHELNDELTRDNVESILFLLDFPAAVRERVKNGKDLFTELRSRHQITADDVHVLVDIFNSIYRMDLANRVRKYQQNNGLFRSIPGPGNRNNTRRPTENCNVISSGPNVKAPFSLLTPAAFISKTKVTSPESRYPVQTGDAFPSLPIPSDQIDEMPSYQMDRNPRGYALIISNEKFDESPENLKERRGTETDADNLEKLWLNLNFIVRVERNLKAHKIYDVVREFSNKDHSNFDCFVCCLLSHGKNGSIFGSDSQLLPLGHITSQLTGVSCPNLVGKPKLFFIQACRGRDFDQGSVIQQDAVQGTEEEAMRHSAEPNESHFLLGYATPPGYVSWRSKVHGSWYISKLCDVLTRFGQTEDLMSMMVKVNQEVSEAFTQKGYRQCPAPVVTLTKKIYLKKLD